jgi:hypothetical protein
VAALLDPSRPSRARPTPADLVRASDATGIPFVELLAALWGIEPQRLADELAGLGLGTPSEGQLAALSEEERRSVAEYVAFLASRHRRAVGMSDRLGRATAQPSGGATGPSSMSGPGVPQKGQRRPGAQPNPRPQRQRQIPRRAAAASPPAGVSGSGPARAGTDGRTVTGLPMPSICRSTRGSRSGIGS